MRTYIRLATVTSFLVLVIVRVVNPTWFIVRPPSQCSVPRSPEHKPFFFGSSDLVCTGTGIDLSLPGLRRKRSAPQRDVTEPIHSWILYDGFYLEFGVIPSLGFKLPFYPSSKVAMFKGFPFLGNKCPWRRDPFPSGYSSVPMECIQRCVARYEVYFGEYELLFNNCHHFVNTMSQILCSDQCPPWCAV